MNEIIQKIFNPQNEFFLLTKDAKRITHISLSSIILPVVFIIFAALITQFLLAPLYFGDPTQASSSSREAFGLYALFGLIILFIFLWVKFFEGRPFYTIGFTKQSAVKKYLFGFSTGVAMNAFIVSVLALSGCIEFGSSNSASTGVNALGSVVVFLFAYIIQGASEEILTRGWMFQVIGARYKPWLGFLISSVLFSLLHMGNNGANILAAINIFLIAVLFSLFVMKDKSIWGACGLHSAWNWTLGNLFGLSVSGTGEKSTLLDLNTTGNELISGGAFGPEASLILTGVLLLIIIFISRQIFINRRTKIYNFPNDNLGFEQITHT